MLVSKIPSRTLWLTSMLLMSMPSLALEQQEASWLALNYQNYLSKDKTWTFLSHNQIRLYNTPYILRTALAENSVGYTLNDAQRIWVGYYWSYNNFSNKGTGVYFNENRLWQQFYWKLESDKQRRVASRTRMEEMNFSDRKQNLYIIRQMLAVEQEKFYFGHLNPLVYDEVFFHLNNPDYATKSALSQNRAFVGFNLYFNRDSFLKIGYINQYETRGHHKKDALTHILSITYTFGAPEISLPIDS